MLFCDCFYPCHFSSFDLLALSLNFKRLGLRDLAKRPISRSPRNCKKKRTSDTFISWSGLLWSFYESSISDGIKTKITLRYRHTISVYSVEVGWQEQAVFCSSDANLILLHILANGLKLWHRTSGSRNDRRTLFLQLSPVAKPAVDTDWICYFTRFLLVMR